VLITGVKMFLMSKVLPMSIFAIGCSALAFQTTVLHPYHEELDQEFRQIRALES
jgi:hypothetical protein